jgi:hypothetical protein
MIIVHNPATNLVLYNKCSVSQFLEQRNEIARRIQVDWNCWKQDVSARPFGEKKYKLKKKQE